MRPMNGQISLEQAIKDITRLQQGEHKLTDVLETAGLYEVEPGLWGTKEECQHWDGTEVEDTRFDYTFGDERGVGGSVYQACNICGKVLEMEDRYE